MAERQLHTVLHYLRQATADRLGHLSDGELLGRFVVGRDEAAFEALVRRHGPLVLGVCRRVLGNAHDAEDAFQATFLVLARDARSVVKRASLGSWLHGVAHRTAVRARLADARRRARERRRPPAPPPDLLREAVWRDVGAVLDAEVRRLPGRWREPFVLCYMQGKTNAEAARLLGCPTGTVLSRLARARQILRARLTRRGLGLSGGLVGALAASGARSAVVPPALVHATVRVAGCWEDNPFAAAAVSARVAALTQGGWTMMLGSRLKGLVLLGVATVGVAVVGVGGMLVPSAGQPPERPPAKSSEERPSQPVPAPEYVMEWGIATPADMPDHEVIRLPKLTFRDGQLVRFGWSGSDARPFDEDSPGIHARLTATRRDAQRVALDLTLTENRAADGPEGAGVLLGRRLRVRQDVTLGRTVRLVLARDRRGNAERSLELRITAAAATGPAINRAPVHPTPGRNANEAPSDLGFPDGPAHDFGVVPQGPEVRHRFAVVNRTDDFVRLVSLRSSCAALKAQETTRLLPPGGRGAIEVTVDTVHLSGPKVMPLYVKAVREGHESEYALRVSVDVADRWRELPGTGDVRPAARPAAAGKPVIKVYAVGDLVRRGADKEGAALVQVITRTVEPSSWAEAGGAGAIEYFPDGKSLVVSQPADVQERVKALLDDLRKAKDAAGGQEGKR